MKATVVFKNGEQTDVVSGDVTDKEFGESVVHPFNSDEYRSIKNRLGDSELLFTDGSVTDIDIESIIEWSSQNEVHILALPQNDNLRCVMCSETQRIEQEISPTDEFLGLIYDNQNRGPSASVELRYEYGNWVTEVYGEDNYDLRGHETFKSGHHLSFGSSEGFNEINGVID